MVKTSIIFDHRNRKRKDGTAPLEVRIAYAHKTYYINTGIYVCEQNFVGGAIVSQYDAEQLNERLQIVYKKILGELNRYAKLEQVPNIEEIRRKINVLCEANEKENSALIDFCEEQEGIMQLRGGTLAHYRTMRLRLIESNILTRWSDLTTENICKWDAWLHKLKKPLSRAEKMAGEQEKYISDGAVYTYHKCLKAILNRAVLFGKIEYNPYDRLRGQFKRGDKENVEFLTIPEMKAIESLHPVKGSMMAIARDLFVFQMHTGLSYADTQAFDFDSYRRMDDGHWVNVGCRVKTGVQYVTRLSTECERILQKYNWSLPKLNNADYNHCLKALGAAVGIEKPLHSHLARHSFATKMTAQGVNIQTVAKMLGHSNITQTQRYAKVLPDTVYDAFRDVEKQDAKLKKKK